MRYFEWPWAIVLGLVLPAIGFTIFNLEGRSRARRLGKLGSRAMLARLAPMGAPVGMWRIVRLTSALALLGFAFSGPRWGLGPNESTGIGVDVVLALDASLSMMATDVQPSRLENMKNVVRQLRTASPTDRFALLGFAGHSYVLSPLTTDQSAIDLYLDKLDPSTVGVAGSSIANAIHQATTLLSTRKEAGDRAIIVLSDGESFEPVTAVKSEATRAGEAGISVITVGFGTPKGSTIPVRDSTGKMTLKRDKAGDTVTTVYMPEFLSAAAQSAHGTFIPADAADKAAQIRKVLDGLKTAPRTTASGTNLLGQFEWFVIPALLLLALDTLLMLRSRKRRLSIATAAAIGTMAVAACQPSGPPAPTAKQAEAAVRAKQEGARLVAYNRGTKLFGPLDKVKRDTLITSDTGLKIARDWLDSATQAKTAEVRDRALYNAGWSRIALVGRMLGLVKAPPMTKADSDSVARAQQGSAPQAAATAMAPGDSTSPTPAQADSAKKARMKDTLMAYINTARAQYKSYLVAHPDDPDAKWNYEMVLLQKQQGGGGGGGKSKPKTGKPKPGKPKPAKGKTPPKQDPPVQKFRLPPQEAKQMLQAASQREQNNSQAKPTPAAAVPGGNDW